MIGALIAIQINRGLFDRARHVVQARYPTMPRIWSPR